MDKLGLSGIQTGQVRIFKFIATLMESKEEHLHMPVG
jgi:hypothetical protein